MVFPYFCPMIDTSIIGQFADLKVLRIIPHGAVLDGEQLGDILLPKRYCSEQLQEEDVVRVFVYFDSEDRIVATTEEPYVKRDEFAFLDVREVNRIGAFMDWGLQKDLLIPYREQKANIQEGGNYLVYCYYDQESERLAGSTKTAKFLDTVPPEYVPDEEVNILVTEEHELGFKCIVDNLFSGMIYHNEIFTPVHIGEKRRGFVKQVREDEKIDVALQLTGKNSSHERKDPILDYLKTHDGVMFITDKSDPEMIYDTFGMSKKMFKKAVGHLYKEKIIRIEKDKIVLNR